MPVLKFIEVEALKVITAQAKPKNFSFGSGKINLIIGIDFEKEFIEKLEEDPLSWQKLQDAASDAYKDFVADCVADIAKADKNIAKLVGDPSMQQAVADVCLAGIKLRAEKLTKEVDTRVKAAWSQVLKTNSDYKKYKWRAAVRVGLQVGGVVISAAGIGGAVATGGVSAVLGVYGMIKGCLGLFKELTKLWLSAEKFRIAINGQVQKLVRAYNAQKKEVRNAKDLGKALINQVFATELATISKCSGDVDQYLKKLDGIDVKSHEISRELGKALAKIDKATSDLRAFTKSNKTLDQSLTKLEAEVNKLIVKIVSKQEMVNEGRAWATQMKTALDLLESGKPGWLKVFEKSFVLIDLGLSFNELSGEADKIVEIAWTAAQAAEELHDDIREAMTA